MSYQVGDRVALAPGFNYRTGTVTEVHRDGFLVRWDDETEANQANVYTDRDVTPLRAPPAVPSLSASALVEIWRARAAQAATLASATPHGELTVEQAARHAALMGAMHAWTQAADELGLNIRRR